MSQDSLPYLENIRIVPLFGRDEEAISELKVRMREASSLSVDFLVLLGSSTVIATLGLFQDSAAVIIGAMIIAPLMRPLMGLAYGSLTGTMLLIRKSLICLIIGTLASVVIAFLLASLLQTIEVTKEIASRTHPNLLDLGVAFFAGSAGAYCQTKKSLADTLAGVAIAVALVPPIGVIGIGLALGHVKIWLGALLLYATNLVGITFAATVVFLFMGYGPVRKAKKSLSFSMLLVFLLAVPLALSMRELVLEHSLSANIKEILKKKTYTFKDVDLESVEVQRFQEPMAVYATIISPDTTKISAKQVRLVQDFLMREIGIPVEFKLRVIPSTVVTALEVTPQGKKEQKVPIGTPIGTASVQWSAEEAKPVPESPKPTIGSDSLEADEPNSTEKEDRAGSLDGANDQSQISPVEPEKESGEPGALEPSATEQKIDVQAGQSKPAESSSEAPPAAGGEVPTGKVEKDNQAVLQSTSEKGDPEKVIEKESDEKSDKKQEKKIDIRPLSLDSPGGEDRQTPDLPAVNQEGL